MKAAIDNIQINGYDCVQYNLYKKQTVGWVYPMSCSLLNPALGYMFLRVETVPLLIKLLSLELGTHGKKSVSTCGIVNTEQQ